MAAPQSAYGGFGERPEYPQKASAYPPKTTSPREQVYDLFQPGKRTPMKVLLLGINPDGTGNFVLADGNNGIQFAFGVNRHKPYDDDASVPYAVPATSL